MLSHQYITVIITPNIISLLADITCCPPTAVIIFFHDLQFIAMLSHQYITVIVTPSIISLLADTILPAH